MHLSSSHVNALRGRAKKKAGFARRFWSKCKSSLVVKMVRLSRYGLMAKGWEHYGSENQESGCKYWATHSLACSALLTTLMQSTVLICSFTCSRVHGEEVFVHDMSASTLYSLNPL